MTDPRQKHIPEELTGLPGYGIEPAKDDAYVAEGKAATHAWGVQYQGTFEGEADGTARAVRAHALALSRAGVPVKLQSFTGRFLGSDGMVHSAEATSEKVKKEVHDLVHASIGTLRVRIKHAVIRGPDFLRSWIIPRSVMSEPDPVRAQDWMRALYQQTIVYSVWERTTIDPNVSAILRRCAECWVPSRHNQQILEENGIERVVVVPHPWSPDNRLAGERQADPSSKRFYAIGIWQPRKGFHELIGAFLSAFCPGDRARLTVKYKSFQWPGYPDADQSVRHWLSDERVRKNGWREENLAPQLALREKFWTDAQIENLHLTSNIYVSSSHGEAFGLPAFDAKLAGNRMIYVPWGGTEDFADSGDIALPFELEPASDTYRWEPGAMWARLDFEALVRALREVRAPEDHARNRHVERAREDVVGSLMKSRIDRLVGSP